MLLKPSEFLESFKIDVEQAWKDYESWWFEEGIHISNHIDRLRTVHLRMYDRWGNRIDELLYPPDYYRMLYSGYKLGIVSEAIRKDIRRFYALGYIVSFYDAGLFCPYTVSLATALAVYKYGSKETEHYLENMLRMDEHVWQGATWMTEAKGGSDLGYSVETTARKEGNFWILDGEKYFASNVGVQLAVVAARPEGKEKGVRNLALFLVPRFKEDGSLNYYVRRIKDKIGTRSVPTGEVEFKNTHAYLLGKLEWGIYEILEVLNVSRVANSIGSVALAQRAMYEAYEFARKRFAFGKYILEHPLMDTQFRENYQLLRKAFALAWESVELLSQVYLEKPKYSERYHMFRLLTHIAKYWTAEVAVRMSKWAMEVHGGMGVLEEFFVERLLREAMILPIWEGTPHRQMLDAYEVMQRKQAHDLLYEYLKDVDPSKAERFLELCRSWLEEGEARSHTYMESIASVVSEILVSKYA